MSSCVRSRDPRIVLLARLGSGARSPWARIRRAAARDIRDGLFAHRAWSSIAIASMLVAVGGWGPRGHHGVGLRRGWAGEKGSRPRSFTASWCLWPACRAPRSSSWHGSVVTDLRSGCNRRFGSEQHMPDRPYTLLSCGMSIDGYLDSAAPRRLELSKRRRLRSGRRRTRFLRRDPGGRGYRAKRQSAAACALASGAATSGSVAASRRPRSRSRVTERLELDACADFFTTGETEKLVYCASPRFLDARSRLGRVATVVDAGEPIEMRTISEDLGRPGRATAYGRGWRQGPHPVSDRQPRR